MNMLMVEEAYLPLTLTVPGITDAQFMKLCQQYENFRVEYTAEGVLLVMPPTDSGTSKKNSWITYQLTGWALSTHGELPTESSGGFLLPSGARRSPDAAWISNGRLSHKPNCPEFVIELISPFDSLKKTRAKMLEWIENGALLAWMINPRKKSVTIYRPGREPETLTGVDRVRGEGPVEGFVLDLERVWQGA